MNKSIIFAAVAILAQLAANNVSAVCPDNFPTIERHTEANHGDVCRNGKYHGFNEGWVCPEGCKESPNSAPYCAMSASDNSPCRVNAKPSHSDNQASESNKDWCCKVVKVHDNTPGRSWGSLALRFDGDEGIRAEWENKGCNSLVSEGWNDGVPGNKNKCSVTLTTVKALDFCCSAWDLYKGAENGGFNKKKIGDTLPGGPLLFHYNKKSCWKYNASNC